ncbi:MAG: tetratricopeptide repeat protein [Lentimicrobium sp.]|nr:tetratricopeptide repeat protein [Lentimicrobium sp.]
MNLISQLVNFILVIVFLLLQNNTYCAEQSEVDSLLLSLKSGKTSFDKISANIELSNIYSNTDLQKALEYAEKAVELAEELEKPEILSKALNNIGNVYFNQGFSDLALAYFYRSLEINKSLGNERGIASLLINIGAISLSTSEFRQAKEEFIEALKRLKELEQVNQNESYMVEIATVYNNLGIACQNLKEFKEAEDYYTYGIELVKQNRTNSNLLANLYNNLASLFLDLKRNEDAYNPMRVALDIRMNLGDKNGEAQSYRMLAAYYVATGDTEKAFDFLYKGYNLAVIIGNISLQSNLVHKLFAEYRRLNESDSALKYHIILNSIEAELNNKEAQRELARLEITAQFKEREQQRELEQKKRESRYILVGIGLLFAVAVLGLFILLSHNRLKRIRLQKDVVDLASKNLALEKSSLEKELDIRNRELATNVMYLVQKNGFITEITEQLMTIKQSHPDNNILQLEKLLNDLKSNRNDKIWKEFEIRFQEVHQDFYKKLNQRFPDLTPNERKLAAFLRLNMTTKEISAITFQLPDSIKTARSRLRKKLGLPQEANIISFLENL